MLDFLMFHQLDTFDRLRNYALQLKIAFAVLHKEGEEFDGLNLSCGEVEAICVPKARWGHTFAHLLNCIQDFYFPQIQRFHPHKVPCAA
jgi:hypothetical protein